MKCSRLFSESCFCCLNSMNEWMNFFFLLLISCRHIVHNRTDSMYFNQIFHVKYSSSSFHVPLSITDDFPLHAHFFLSVMTFECWGGLFEWQLNSHLEREKRAWEENSIVQPGWDHLVSLFSSLLLKVKQLIIIKLVSTAFKREVRDFVFFRTRRNWIVFIFAHSWLVYILLYREESGRDDDFLLFFMFGIIDEFFIYKQIWHYHHVDERQVTKRASFDFCSGDLSFPHSK